MPLLHQPPPLLLALVRAGYRAESTAHRSRKAMGGWPVTMGQDPVGVGGFAEGRSKQQTAHACQLDRAASPACSCTSGGHPALPRVRRASGLLGLGEMNAFPGCSVWLCCAASRRKEDLLPSQHLVTGQRQEPAWPQGKKEQWLWGTTKLAWHPLVCGGEAY